MAEEWMNQAACRGMDTDLWFHQGYGSARALRICGTCHVTSECLEYQMDFESGERRFRYGVFGGLQPEDRRKLYDVRR